MGTDLDRSSWLTLLSGPDGFALLDRLTVQQWHHARVSPHKQTHTAWYSMVALRSVVLHLRFLLLLSTCCSRPPSSAFRAPAR